MKTKKKYIIQNKVPYRCCLCGRHYDEDVKAALCCTGITGRRQKKD